MPITVQSLELGEDNALIEIKSRPWMIWGSMQNPYWSGVFREIQTDNESNQIRIWRYNLQKGLKQEL